MRRNKYKLLTGILILTAIILSGCKAQGGDKITVSEAGHTVSHAPFYAAIEKGYFQEEGLNINLVNGWEEDTTRTALAEGDCDIALMGPSAAIYSRKEGAGDPSVIFAQLTQRAGSCLVSRIVNENFSWVNVKGKTVLGSSKGD